MRAAAVAVAIALIAVVRISSQAPAHPYGLDPYKPSDAALLRNYGGALVAQTPLTDLRKLDPYKPSHAALLRQIGGGIPIWGLVWYPTAAGFAPLTPFPRVDGSETQAPSTAPPGAVFIQRDDLPTVRPDPSRESTAVAKGTHEPRARACWIRLGDRTITC